MVILYALLSFLFNDTATTEIYTLSLHDALPIYLLPGDDVPDTDRLIGAGRGQPAAVRAEGRSEEHTSELQSHSDLVCRLLLEKKKTTETMRDEACDLKAGAHVLGELASKGELPQ